MFFNSHLTNLKWAAFVTIHLQQIAHSGLKLNLMQFFTLPTPVANTHTHTHMHFHKHIHTHIETHAKQGPVSNICELFSFSHFARCVRSEKRKLTASLCHLQHTPHPETCTHTHTFSQAYPAHLDTILHVARC